MLTKEQIELVKTTVPVLREHGVASSLISTKECFLTIRN